MADVNWTTDITVSGADFVSSIDTELINVNAEIDIGMGMPVIYTGATTVIPSVTEQELETENKLVLQNITIEQIPYSAVSNVAGGYTVNIG